MTQAVKWIKFLQASKQMEFLPRLQKSLSRSGIGKLLNYANKENAFYKKLYEPWWLKQQCD